MILPPSGTTKNYPVGVVIFLVDYVVWLVGEPPVTFDLRSLSNMGGAGVLLCSSVSPLLRFSVVLVLP